MNIIKNLAYRIVLKDLKKVNLFTGTYDARSGRKEFMYGVNTVMECIAYMVGQKTGDEFCDEFVKNMIKSEDIAEKRISRVDEYDDLLDYLVDELPGND